MAMASTDSFAAVPKRKNVVIILADEQRWDTLGCAGVFRDVKTPNIDALAAEGAHFTHCYSPNPICCPARACFWTGLESRNNHVTANWKILRPDLQDKGLVHPFANAGYHTFYAGKWHVPGTTPERMGFEQSAAIPAILKGNEKGRFIRPYRQYAEANGYPLVPGHIENLTVKERELYGKRNPLYGKSTIPFEHYLENWVTRKFLGLFDKRPAGKPFFSVVSYNAPHFPMIVPAPYDSAISPDADILPPNFLEGVDGKPEEVLTSKHYRGKVSRAHWKQLIAHYNGFCKMLDDLVGRVVDALRAAGELDNTLIVYTSDHGDMMGSHGMFMKGYDVQYEEAHRVPLVVRDPSLKGVAASDRFVTLLDVMPTIAERCGVDLKETIDGRSFANLLEDPKGAPIREYVTAESFRMPGVRNAAGRLHTDTAIFGANPKDSFNMSLRTPRERYMFRYNDIDEYYDLEKDPHENVNVAAYSEYADRVEACREILLRELRADTPVLAQAVERRMTE